VTAPLGRGLEKKDGYKTRKKRTQAPIPLKIGTANSKPAKKDKMKTGNRIGTDPNTSIHKVKCLPAIQI
jgi:hypothetical protein